MSEALALGLCAVGAGFAGLSAAAGAVEQGRCAVDVAARRGKARAAAV